jgi:hypothetical protein
MKLEYKIYRAIYLDKKLYAVETTDNKIIKKAVGMNSKQLTIDNYFDFVKGIPLTTSDMTFKVDWENMKISIKEQTKTRRYNPSLAYAKLSEVEVEVDEEVNQKSNKVSAYLSKEKRGGKRSHPLTTTYRPNLNGEGSTNQKRKFSTINNPSISVITDNTKSKNFINREEEGTLYKVYHIKWDNQFNTNLRSILEDMFDNNEFVVFNMYFMVLPEKKNVIIKTEKQLTHMLKYEADILNNQIVKVFKNTGMVLAKSILVLLSLYDNENLMNISKDIRIQMIDNINQINKIIHEDFPRAYFR